MLILKLKYLITELIDPWLSLIILNSVLRRYMAAIWKDKGTICIELDVFLEQVVIWNEQRQQLNAYQLAAWLR